MSGSGLNLLVFRAGHRRLRGRQLKEQLLQQLESVSPDSSGDELLGALLRAGELESSATDADSNAAGVLPFAQLTDRLADALLSGQLSPEFFKTTEDLALAPVPELLDLSIPEGFAYYALHPLCYADVLEKLPPLSQHIVVVGIRTIGTTLSAVTAAAARQRGHHVVRMTVRPAGHPYNRETEFIPQQRLALQDAIVHGADFLVVDEGPGLSGSSFLSVAEALERTGIALERITLICGHKPNPEALCSTDAGRRWRRFRSVAAGGECRRPRQAALFIGGGEWRELLFPSAADWPASWITMERLKYLSADRRRLFKFAGLGHYALPVFERERAVAEAGFGPEPRLESDGFISYPWISGRTAAVEDLSPATIERLAAYCAFRAEAFAADANPAPLQEMAEHNLSQLGADVCVNLELQRPVIADGRMQPHEWIISENGTLWKTDSGSRGDDHFFPGPTDIAWDLAGAIVEWRMRPAHALEFLGRYCNASGDDPRARIEGFIRAYSVFRWAYCKMAANAMQGTPEQKRLEAAAENYSRAVVRASAKPALSVSLAG